MKGWNFAELCRPSTWCSKWVWWVPSLTYDFPNLLGFHSRDSLRESQSWYSASRLTLECPDSKLLLICKALIFFLSQIALDMIMVRQVVIWWGCFLIWLYGECTQIHSRVAKWLAREKRIKFARSWLVGRCRGKKLEKLQWKLRPRLFQDSTLIPEVVTRDH